MEIRLKYARNELLFIFLSPIISSPCQSTGVCQKNANYVSIHRVRTRSRTWRGQSKRNFEIEPVKREKLTPGRASPRRELILEGRNSALGAGFCQCLNLEFSVKSFVACIHLHSVFRFDTTSRCLIGSNCYLGIPIRAGFLDFPFIPSGLHRGGVLRLERGRAEISFSRGHSSRQKQHHLSLGARQAGADSSRARRLKTSIAPAVLPFSAGVPGFS